MFSFPENQAVWTTRNHATPPQIMAAPMPLFSSGLRRKTSPAETKAAQKAAR